MVWRNKEMNYRKITAEEYKKKTEPVQYVGYYVLHHKELGLPEPEVFFVEEDIETMTRLCMEYAEEVSRDAKLAKLRNTILHIEDDYDNSIDFISKRHGETQLFKLMKGYKDLVDEYIRPLIDLVNK